MQPFELLKGSTAQSMIDLYFLPIDHHCNMNPDLNIGTHSTGSSLMSTAALDEDPCAPTQ
jgi:hypothetical protein